MNNGVGAELLQFERFLFLWILSIFLIANDLFDVIMKCLFRGDSYWGMMRIEIKIIITLHFFKKYFKKIFFFLVIFYFIFITIRILLSTLI